MPPRYLRGRRYQWQAAGAGHRYVNLAAQTRATLRLTAGLVGKQVRVRVGVRTATGVRSVTSKATVPVAVLRRTH